MDEKPKGGDPALSIFPENRPRDENGATIPTPADARAQSIEDARISREKATYEQGFAGGNSNNAREEAGERARGGGRRR